MNDFDFIAKSMVAEKLLIERIASARPQLTHSGRFGSITPGRGAGRAFCPRCGHDVELLSFAAALLMFNADREAVESWTRCGSVHRLHNRSGLLMICSRSLLKSFATDVPV
ncbi:MAG TPA: hypothetical protein VNA22_01780 [Pyrinomonadaceae bacterium]|nr:hypothetical protein [Pyrinomonadaceae bacterium]